MKPTPGELYVKMALVMVSTLCGALSALPVPPWAHVVIGAVGATAAAGYGLLDKTWAKMTQEPPLPVPPEGKP